MASKQAQPQQPAQPPQPSTEPLGLLEEDDEFEEFESDNWGKDEEETAAVAQQWADDWDDEQIDDDFSKQLRAELEKGEKANKMET